MAKPLQERQRSYHFKGQPHIMRGSNINPSGLFIVGIQAGGMRGVKWLLQFSFALFIIPSSKQFGLRPIRLRGLGHCYFWRLPPDEAQAFRKNRSLGF